MAFDPVTAGIDIAGKIIDRLWPDPKAADAAKLEIFKMTQSGEMQKMMADTEVAKAAAGVVEAEAKSESWLTRTWRPITMLIFVSLITARMFGWTSKDLSMEEELKLWELVEIGLNGYIFLRGGKQIVQAAAPIFNKKPS